jgi:hypothetical protein
MTCSHHDIPSAHIMVRTSHTSMRWWRYLLCINLTWWAGGISWWQHVILQWDNEDTCFCSYHDIPPAHHVRLIQSKYLHCLIEVWHVLTMIYLQLIMLGWYKASMSYFNEMMKILALYQLNMMSWRYIMVRTCHTSMRWWRCTSSSSC